jgi:hypothetical protein
VRDGKDCFAQVRGLPTSASELADVQRWLVAMKRALRAGEYTLAQRFFANAQQAAGRPASTLLAA